MADCSYGFICCEEFLNDFNYSGGQSQIFRRTAACDEQTFVISCIYSIKIIYNGKSVEGKALYDSGNTLCDCFSGKPVVIADEKFIKKLTENDKLENMKNYRLIPFSTISGNGTIPAFMADCVEIYVSGNKYNVENVYIGLTENKIISGDYSALLGSPFFDLISDNKLKLQGGEYEKKR